MCNVITQQTWFYFYFFFKDFFPIVSSLLIINNILPEARKWKYNNKNHSYHDRSHQTFINFYILPWRIFKSYCSNPILIFFFFFWLYFYLISSFTCVKIYQYWLNINKSVGNFFKRGLKYVPCMFRGCHLLFICVPIMFFCFNHKSNQTEKKNIL